MAYSKIWPSHNRNHVSHIIRLRPRDNRLCQIFGYVYVVFGANRRINSAFSCRVPVCRYSSTNLRVKYGCAFWGYIKLKLTMIYLPNVHRVQWSDHMSVTLTPVFATSLHGLSPYFADFQQQHDWCLISIQSMWCGDNEKVSN